ncbi:MAG: hypothetical protein V1808_00565 [Candidatus Daviesbacteria bacterium]
MLKSKRNKLIIFTIFTLLVLFLNAFPNYYAYLKTPLGFSFSGQASWFDPWDLNLYVSAISWGQTQGILLSNIYTTIPNNPILFYPIYTISGNIFPNVDPFLFFHFLAATFGLCLLVALWQTIKIFLTSINDQFVALILISLGGGVGWLFFPDFSSSDLFMTGFTFTSHFQRAHEALGITFYLLSLCLFYLASIKGKNIFALGSSIFLILLIFLYPFYLLSYFLICGAFALLKILQNNKKSFVWLLGQFIVTLPILFLYNLHLGSNHFFGGVLSQKLDNQSLWQIILGFGILSPLIILQLKNPKNNAQFYFLNFWFFISFFLSFFPFGFARFYLRILFFPAILLVILNLDLLSKYIKLSKKVILILLLLTVPISSFYIFAQRIKEAGSSNRWFYITADEKKAIDFIKIQEKDGILAAYTLGNYIPAIISKKVYFGHLLQTPNSDQKINQLVNFYSNKFSESEAKNFLEENKINYIIWGPDEQKITSSTLKDNKLKYSFLKTVFLEDDTFIYSN